MENIHQNQLVSLLTAASSAFGTADALALVERTVDRILDWQPGDATSEPSAVATTIGVSAEPKPYLGNKQTRSTDNEFVLGLPNGAKWERLPIELKLVKDAVEIAKSSVHGFVLLAESGGYYYATYDSSAKLIKVPHGFRTLRKPFQQYIPLNGTYRWVLVGVVKEPNT